MTVPKVRKKAFAPKVRTGCAKCRARRIKCDETKPQCIRCRNKGHQCEYSTPDIWVFESGSTNYADVALAVSQVRRDLLPQAGSHEEQEALRFYVERTAPWMGQHEKPEAKTFWTTTLPRLFQAAPGTRHLIAAIGLLEMPTSSTDQSLLRRRSQRVNYHYTLALHELTLPCPHKVDVIIAPILAWLLEVLMEHGPRAAIHAKAVGRLSKVGDASFVPQSELETVVSDVLRARCLRSRCDVVPPSTDYMYDAVRIRGVPIERLQTTNIISAFESFFEGFEPEGMTPQESLAAESFLSRWEKATLTNVYRSDEPSEMWSSIHFLCGLASHVLPTPIDVYFPDAGTLEHGLDFALEKCELLFDVQLPQCIHQRSLQRVAKLMIHLMRAYTPDSWQQKHEKRLLQAQLRHEAKMKTLRM